MKLRRFAPHFVLFLATIAAAPAQSPPKIPTKMGYCVTVVDADGKLIGTVDVPLHKPDPAKLDEFKASLMNAVNLIGRTTNRPDVIRASASIQLIDNPVPPLRTPPSNPRPPKKNPRLNSAEPLAGGGPDGCFTRCTCAAPIYCSTTEPGTAGDPTTTAIRKNPRGPGGAICGCEGACGGCEKCMVVCSG